MDTESGVATAFAPVDSPGAADGRRHPPSSRFNLIAWAAANSIGLSVALSVPLWIGDFAGRFGLPPWSGGFAATLEMALAAGANILWANLSPRYPSRWIALGFILAIAAAQQCVASSSAALAFIGLVIAGICSGCLLAVLNKQVALSPAPHRGYAILSFLHVGYGVALYLVAPRLQAKYGANSLFLLLSGIAVVGAPLMWFLPAGRRAPTLQSHGALVKASILGVLGLIGLASLLTGHEAISAYMVLLGEPLKLNRVQVGGIIAAGSAIGLCGTVLAGVIPAQFGYVKFIAAALAGMAMIDVVMHFPISRSLFAICFIALQTLLVFAAPRIFSYLAVLDHSGRSAGMAPASLLIGSSFGPLLGNLVGAPTNVDAVPLAAAGTGVLSCALFILIGALRLRASRRE